MWRLILQYFSWFSKSVRYFGMIPVSHRKIKDTIGKYIKNDYNSCRELFIWSTMSLDNLGQRDIYQTWGTPSGQSGGCRWPGGECFAPWWEFMSRILHLVNVGLRYGRSKGSREYRLEDGGLGNLAAPWPGGECFAPLCSCANGPAHFNTQINSSLRRWCKQTWGTPSGRERGVRNTLLQIISRIHMIIYD